MTRAEFICQGNTYVLFLDSQNKWWLKQGNKVIMKDAELRSHIIPESYISPLQSILLWLREEVTGSIRLIACADADNQPNLVY